MLQARIRVDLRKPNRSANRQWSAFCRAALILAIVIYASLAGAQSSPSTVAGRQAFESICASCHGLNGKGGERAPDIATRPEIVKLSDNNLLGVLREGRPQAGMPAFRDLGTAKLSELLNYLRLLQGKRSQPAPAEDIGKGRELFFGKAGCSQCHMVRGAGGFIAPDLSDYGASHSADEIRDSILSPGKRPAFRKGLATVTTSEGQALSGFVRNEDNFSLQLQSMDGSFHLLEKSGLREFRMDARPLMPSDYDSRLSKAELDEIVAYISGVGNGAVPSDPKTRK